MADALHDANNVPTLMGVQVDGTITPLKIDNTTGYLLASVSLVSSTSPTFTRSDAKKDDNNVSTLLAKKADGTTFAPLIDNRNNRLWGTLT